MKTQELLYPVSRDAMFASTINHFIGSIVSDSKEERELFTKILEFSLSVLIPQQVKTDKEKAQATYIAIMAKATGIMELEAKMLTLLKPVTDTESFKLLADLDYSTLEKNEEYAEIVAQTVMPFVQVAGVDNLEKGFNEIDNLNFMVEDQELQGETK